MPGCAGNDEAPSLARNGGISTAVGEIWVCYHGPQTVTRCAVELKRLPVPLKVAEHSTSKTKRGSLAACSDFGAARAYSLT